ncbi:SDR family NAD(P)-dependent oxidoreductase [Rubrobacter calidifluminis]|uniref:SDR family NAD(P)-dependent oxidoreductase n=1 Tax=Rubrobacter calidifluminis TaxID=1392640 RepID=UPI002362A7AF|nr:SDR family oxidoreductase [Rubrobacter calidifluminis]
MDKSSPIYVITGATGGIGGALCRRLARRGARLALAARGEERLQRLAGELDAFSIPLDVSAPGEMERLFQATADEFGRIDGAVNCVGSFLIKPAHLTSHEEFEQTFALNAATAFAMVRAAANHMQDGSVVLLSSVAATTGLANHEAISAAKGAVAALTRSAATSYAPRGLRFNAVAPGLVETRMTERVTRSEASRRASTELHPLGRLGKPEDIASVIEWLLSPEQSWITGQVIGVDGGLSSLHPMPRRSPRS